MKPEFQSISRHLTFEIEACLGQAPFLSAALQPERTGRDVLLEGLEVEALDFLGMQKVSHPQ